MSALYDELAIADREHGDVAVYNDDTGWFMPFYRDGRVILGHRDFTDSRRQSRHLVSVSKGQVIRLWRLLVDGDMTTLDAEPWKPGYGTAGAP